MSSAPFLDLGIIDLVADCGVNKRLLLSDNGRCLYGLFFSLREIGTEFVDVDFCGSFL